MKDLSASKILFWAVVAGAIAGSFSTLLIALVFSQG